MPRPHWNDRQDEVLRKDIETCLKKGKRSTREIAQELGIAPSTLWRKMRKLGFVKKEAAWTRE